jgi:hypothetical protein
VIVVLPPGPAGNPDNPIPPAYVPPFDAAGVPERIPADAAALVFASGRPATEADGSPAPAVVARDTPTPVHPPVEARPAAPAGTASRTGIALLSAGGQAEAARPALAPPESIPRPAAVPMELPPPEPKPGDRTLSSFAAEAADVLTQALSVSLATFDRAMRDLTGAQGDAHQSGAAVLYWLGLSSWVVSGALAYEMLRRRDRVAPALGAWTLPDEDDPFLENLA